MKIGVDIRVLMDKNYSGVSEYAANLLSAMLRIDGNDSFKLFYNSYHGLDGRLEIWNTPKSEVIGTHWPNKFFNYFLQSLISWPKIDQVLGGTDVFWSPHFNFTSLGSETKRIITVHDLSFLRYPHFFSARKNFWHRSLRVKKVLRQADHIIAVSENTKNDVVELAGIEPSRVSVIYSGCNVIKREFPVAKTEPFILYLGNIEPRKNIAGLIEAFNMLKASEKKAGRSGLKLVLAGADGWKNSSIYAAWKNSPYRADISFLGYVNREEKERLYATASLFVYPSYYEGFGFPPLEAMAYGLPVVCSNVSSLPEVVGEAAIMVNPDKSSEIAGAMEMILSDQELRERLVSKGLERAALFSWERAAEKYLRLFREVYENKKAN